MVISVLPSPSASYRRLSRVRFSSGGFRFRVCPECAGPIVRASGCLHCAHCGWGHCG